MTNRVGHIDIAKGVSIILVALFHSNLYYFAPNFIDSMGLFRMPLFFFLSGVFFSTVVDVRTFLWKKSDALLKPYFATLLTLFFISVIFKEDHLTSQLKGIIYGNGDTIRWVPMWFLTHLFAVYCFTYFIFRFTGIRDKGAFYKLSVVAILMLIGTQWVTAFWQLKIVLPGKEITLPGLPFSLDLVFISSSFFMMGAFLRKMVIDFRPNVQILLVSVLVFVAIQLLTDARIGLNNRIYINPLLATTGAICGIYFVMVASFYINKTIILRNIFLTFGQASLFILIFHYSIQAMAYNYFSGLVDYDLGFWGAISAFLISIVTPVLIMAVATRNKVLSFIYLPLKPDKHLQVDALRCADEAQKQGVD